jgi:hypothetical protein
MPYEFPPLIERLERARCRFTGGDWSALADLIAAADALVAAEKEAWVAEHAPTPTLVTVSDSPIYTPPFAPKHGDVWIHAPHNSPVNGDARVWCAPCDRFVLLPVLHTTADACPKCHAHMPESALMWRGPVDHPLHGAVLHYGHGARYRKFAWCDDCGLVGVNSLQGCARCVRSLSIE